jgi:CHASE1-domain containing sensor protein
MGATLVCLVLVIIKVLFAVLVLSSIALIGVAIAVFVRVWWHLKSRRAPASLEVDASEQSHQESLP